MAHPTKEIRSVIVAGSGPLPWIAALGLWRALRNRQLEVHVVDTGSAADAAVGRWTLPSQRGMHALLGIAEPQLVEQTGATFKLATQHLEWQGAGSRFLHAHGEIGREIGNTPFYKFLQNEVLAGRPERPEAFSVAGAAAPTGKFARPMGESNSLTATFTYGFHLEDSAYTSYLRASALRQGVGQCAAALADVMRSESGGIRALRLADGREVSADYFIDCSGPAARLLSSISTGEREDWSAWLPCDRMWSALGPAVSNPPAMTQTRASEAGWFWRAPLAQASMVGQVYSSRFQDDAAAFSALCSMEPSLRGDARLTRFSAGRRRKVWEANCVALGSAAVELEPLAGADLHLAQIGLGTFIEFFPRDAASEIEADEYNHLMAEHADALRDFTLAHYHAGPPRPGEFWSAVRAQPLPARLANKLDLYAANGRINMLDHETFEETDWAWLLMGSGCAPASIELQVQMLLARIPRQEVNALRTQVQQVAASMPPHIEFVRRQASLAARAPR